jgi:nicotinamidase-related amidase
LKIFGHVSEELLKMRATRTALMPAATLSLMLMLGACARNEPVDFKDPRTALVLIDFQNDYLRPDGRMAVAQNQVDQMLTAANGMIDAARKNAIDVIYVRNEFSRFEFIGNMLRNDAALRYEAGSELDPRLDGTAGVYFNKEHGDAFSNSEFGSHLEALNLGNLVIAGVYAGGSVGATALDAMKRGYKVTVISDAIAAADDEARDKALAELKGAGAQIETSAQFIASLGSANPSS